MPICARALGSETVGSMRPRSSGRPLYWSRLGKTLAALRDLQTEHAAGIRAAQLLRDSLPGFDEFVGLGLPPILQ